MPHVPPPPKPVLNTAGEDQEFPAFLEEDLAAAHALEVEDFFRTILGVSVAWVDAHHSSLKEIVQSREWRDAGSGSGSGFGQLVGKATEMLTTVGLIDTPPTFSVLNESPSLLPSHTPGVLTTLLPSTAARSTFHEAHLRLAKAAHSQLSHGSWRSFVLGAVVVNGKIQLAYFDHSIIVISRPFHILQQPVLYLTLLCGLGRLQAYSPIPGDTGVAVDHSHPGGIRLRLSNGALIQLGEVLHQQTGLVGRATCVVRVEQTERCSRRDWDGKRLVMKILWAPKQRMSEVDVIGLARERAVATGEVWVLEHLPDVLHCQEYVTGDEGMQARLQSSFGECYEERVLRMVVEEELQPLGLLRDPVELATVARDVFQCYRWLYEECNISHRDISHSNVMWLYKKACVKGVLNDFDLASVGESTERQPPSHGTGTRLFMAIELLGTQIPPHYYRHDLESLMYVMLWHASRYTATAILKPSPYERWGLPLIDSDILEAYKIRFIHDEVPQLTSHCEALKDWICRMQLLFRRGFQARRNAQEAGDVGFDEETLGGVVTFDSFARICDQSLLELVAKHSDSSRSIVHL
ncbi:hypothetical protein EIP91_006061 [Steccherinum ochraceum]|uniref:Protein kinase domain-containing protein n=1 Tax=Steccherinum ochraceum TaxID=92696 RepID=A0A4R0RH34_9APHY|nr:hypothetical protein EIP91_006061 [Steccherinum ochraceum]